MDVEQKQREWLRWQILRALYANQPVGLTETMIHYVTDAEFPEVDLDGIKRHIEYLETVGLVREVEKTDNLRRIDLTAEGWQYVEGYGDDIDGVARG